MRSTLFGYTTASQSASAVNYLPISGVSSSGYNSIEATRLVPLAASVLISNLSMNLNAAPASGKSYLFTLRKNGADTGLTLTISNTNTSGVSTGAPVAFAAGDTISISCTPTGTPTVATLSQWSVAVDSVGGEFSLLVGGGETTTNLSTSVPSYAALTGVSNGASTWSATEATQRFPIPVPGSISNLYILSDAAPGGSASYAVALVKNGTSQALVATNTAAATRSNDTTHSVAYSAGDTISISNTPTSTPTAARYGWCAQFTPTTPGNSFFGFASADVPSTTTTQYEAPLSVGANGYSGTEASRQIMIGQTLIKSLYLDLGTAPGGATTRTATVRQNAAGTAATVSLTSTNTTGNITSLSVLINPTDLMALQMAETGTPAADTGGVGIGIGVFMATTPQTQLGKASIIGSTTQTILGKSRIALTTTQIQTGKASISSPTTRTQTGKARITSTTSKTITGKARIQQGPVSPYFIQATTTVDTTTDYKGFGYSGSQRKIDHNSSGRRFVALRKPDSGTSTYEPFVDYSDDGVTWTSVEVATITTDHQRVPSIAVDSSDIVHIVWYGKDPSNTGTDQRQIKYAHSLDNGATWSSWVSVGGDVSGYVGTDTLWQEHPCIFPDPSNPNNLYVVWEGADGSHAAQQVKFSKSTDGGATWSGWVNIAGNGSRPGITMTQDGKLHVVFYSSAATSGSVQQAQHVISSDKGATWGSNNIIGDTGFDGRSPSVVSEGNNLHAAWRMTNATYTTTQIFYSMWNGSTWSTPVTISPILATYQFFAQIAFIKGQPTVIWMETTNASSYPSEDPTTGNIYISRLAGGSWTARQAISSSGTDLYPYLDKTSLKAVYSTNASTPFNIVYDALFEYGYWSVIGKARIVISTPQTILGKSRITTTTTQSQLGRARVTSTTTQNQTGKARITVTTTKTITGLARIALVTSKTQTGKARLTVTTLKAQTGVARITVTTVKTILGKASLGLTTLRTQLGKANIKNNTLRLQQGLARITVTTLQTQLGKSRISLTTTRTQTGKARVTSTTTQTILGKGDIKVTTTRTQTGLARIVIQTTKTQTGKSRLTITTTRTQLGRANIDANTTQIQLGRARIQFTTLKTILGLARITQTTLRTITGLARITAITGQTQLGRAKLVITTVQTVTGKARVTLVNPRTQTGHARITVVTSQTILGKSRISLTTTRTQTGKAKIFVTTSRTLLGKARVTAIVPRTITGKASIIAPYQRRNPVGGVQVVAPKIAVASTNVFIDGRVS